MHSTSQYGDQRRIYLTSRLDSRETDSLKNILENPLHVLSCSYWNNFAPWHVTARTLPDNFCLFVLSGKVQLILDDSKCILSSGEGFLLPYNAKHEFALAPGEKKCRHIIFHALPLNAASVNPIDHLISPCHKIPILEAEREFLLDVIALVENGNQAAVSFCDNFLNKVLMNLAKQGKFKQFPDYRQSPRLNQIIGYMEQNYQANIAIADAAAAAEIHEVQCRKLFKRHLDTSPSEYLRKIRLNHAVKLLLNTNDSIKEIAWLSGFSSDRYFCYVFKKYFRCSPENYRQSVHRTTQ